MSIDAYEHTTGSAAENPTPAPSGKRFTKRSWITLAASAGALIIAAAFAVPVISSNVAYGAAIDELSMSEADLAGAHAALVKATDELAGAAGDAVTVYEESGAFTKVVRKELLADPAVFEDLTGARTELVDVAGLTLDGEVATAPEKSSVPNLPTQDTPSTMEAIAQQAQENEDLAERFAKDAKSTRDAVADIAKQSETIAELTEDVISSGAEFGAAVKGLDKATATTVTGLKAAVTALADKETPAIGRIATYNGAYDALKKSHDAAVAAEKAAADEAARRNQGSDRTPSNGSTPPKNGGSNGGVSTPPKSGGSHGGSTPSKPAPPKPAPSKPAPSKPAPPKPAPAPAPPKPAPKVPAKFVTNGNYVPIGQCDGAFHSSHQVGWGGTSTSGNSLASRGKWSATVKGDTVTYYLCF